MQNEGHIFIHSVLLSLTQAEMMYTNPMFSYFTLHQISLNINSVMNN